MRTRSFGAAAALLLLAGGAGADWPQFRGVNATGVSNDTNLPVHFGPGKNLVWQTPLPGGYSSPSVAGDRVFITALEDERLFTFGLRRRDGRVLWRREAPRPRRQPLQETNHPVTATPVTDGKKVYVFFADFGLLGYDRDGRELWRLPLGPFNNPFGHGSSPILVGDLVLQNCDQDAGSFLIAVDKATGRVRWKTERPHAQRGYATPVVYHPPGAPPQVLVIGSYEMTAYEVATGRPVWWVRGLPWQIKPTPVVAEDAVYFATFSGESDPGLQEVVAPFAEVLARQDLDRDGRLSKDEIVDERAKARFAEYLDLDDTGFLEERDWDQFRMRRAGMSSVWAFRLGGQGDMTDRSLLWKSARSLPNVPSPLLYRGVLYTLKEGGILTALDPRSGDVVKQGRLTGALGGYSASPVAADGKLYTVSEDGAVTVIRAGADWEILAVNDLDAPAKATPAITGGRLYVRTANALFCFEQKAAGRSPGGADAGQAAPDRQR
jgi:outer membrane protein assembly factor BamB